MFDAFWDDFKWKIFGFCFVPYLIYFTTSFIYMTNMLYLKDETAEIYDFGEDEVSYIIWLEPPFRAIFGVLLSFHFGIQCYQISREGVRQHFD